MHRHGLLLAPLLLASCAGGTEREEGALVPARNLLLISLDTTRADRLGCYGYAAGRTPRLDALAAEGARFASAWTPMTSTLPAHAAALTARHPRSLGVTANRDRLPAEARTLAEELRASGFATGAFVSSAVLDPEGGLDQGFDLYEAPEGNQRRFRANRVVDAARVWIGGHLEERFFCFVHLYDPHASYDPPRGLRASFDLPDEGSWPPFEQLQFMVEPEGLTDELRAVASRAYDAEIGFVDGQVGRLVEDLRLVGALEETVVVVLSDHGETLDELATEYGYAYDHGEFLHPRELRVPLIVRAPRAQGFPGALVPAQPVGLLDVMPTALELLGLPVPAECEGRSLVPLLAGDALEPRPIVARRHRFIGAPPNAWMEGEEHALVLGAWLRVVSDGRADELYDLAADPDARVNLLESEPERARRLEERLEAWLERTPAGTPTTAGPSAERRDALDALGYGGGG